MFSNGFRSLVAQQVCVSHDPSEIQSRCISKFVDPLIYIYIERVPCKRNIYIYAYIFEFAGSMVFEFAEGMVFERNKGLKEKKEKRDLRDRALPRPSPSPDSLTPDPGPQAAVKR